VEAIFKNDTRPDAAAIIIELVQGEGGFTVWRRPAP
jgi:4-aminobutyrate aminotransferase-like enzyme